MFLDNSNEKNAEFLLRVSEPFLRIAEDEAMQKALADVHSLMGKGPVIQSLGLMRLVPLFLKDHKRDLYEIVAAVSEKTVDEVAKQSTRETIAALKTLMQDEDIARFFSPSANQENESGN